MSKIKQGAFSNTQGLSRKQREALFTGFFRDNISTRLSRYLRTANSRHTSAFLIYTEEVYGGKCNLDREKWLRLLNACELEKYVRAARWRVVALAGLCGVLGWLL